MEFLLDVYKFSVIFWVLASLLAVAYFIFFWAVFTALMIFGTIIHECYEDLDDSERRKNNRENINSDGEPEKSISLFRKFISYQIRIFGKFDFERSSSILVINIFPNPDKLDDLLIKPSVLRANPAASQSAKMEANSLLSLRFGNYPWRK